MTAPTGGRSCTPTPECTSVRTPTEHGVARCPHCRSIFGRRTAPLLDGTPVLMCTSCHRIATDKEWSTP